MSVVVAATAFAVAACKGSDDAGDTDTGAVTTSGGDVASSPSPAIVMSFLTTVNRGEIEAGKLAREKATNARVREHARMMVTDHGRALEEAGAAIDTTAISTPVGQAAVDAQALHEQSMNILHMAAQGMTFDSTYIAMMVTGHRDVLARLDGMNGAAATDPVHTQLQSSVEMIRTHLQRAQEVQQSLKGGR